MNKGKVSVIMGIYNCAETLPKAIDSILNQTYSNIEIIMCDDCSTDNTYRVALDYAEKFSNIITVIRNEKNSTLAFSLNRCLELATGEFVARMDGDDISDKNRFEKQVEFLRSNQEYCLCGTQMQMFWGDSFGKIVSKKEFPDRYAFREGVPFNHATIMTYKWVYDELDGYCVSKYTTRYEDGELWYRFLFNNFRGANIQEPLYYVREDENAIFRRKARYRWYSFVINIKGYKMLRYPLHWYYIPFLWLLKALIPPQLVVCFRKVQKSANGKRK